MDQQSKELLDLAAQAILKHGANMIWGRDSGEPTAYWMLDFERWNPLESNADALNAAIRFQMDVMIHDQQVEVVEGYTKRMPFRASFPIGVLDQAEQATRLVITRALAEIGKAEGGAA